MLILLNYSGKLDGSVTPDSREYIWLAQNFTGSYGLTGSINPYLSLRRTPIYPLFLSIFSQGNGLLSSLLVQQLLSVGIACLTWLLARKLYTEKIAWISTFLVSIETALLSSSFMILSETLFTFLFLAGIVTFVYAENSHSRLVYYTLSGLLFGLSSLTRPIGIAIIIIIVLHILMSKDSKRLESFIAIFVTLTLIIAWSLRSFVSFGIFDVSSIQSHNLHLFEGSGARAYRLGIPLDEVHALESDLMKRTLGDNFTLEEEQKYRTTRGLNLIFNNFPWFIQMHIIGAVKLLIGPGQGDSLSFLTSGKVFVATNVWHFLLLGLLLTVTLSIFLMATVGIYKRARVQQPIVLVSLLVIIVISSGIQAYARFRAPIAPLLCIFAAAGIYELLKRLRAVPEMARFKGFWNNILN